LPTSPLSFIMKASIMTTADNSTILIVDDERQIVEIVKAYLEREGYRTIASYDGKSALDLARKEHPDLIVLDLMLPGLTGWDVCRTLRAESDVPIIMLTARDDTTDKIVGLELGADDYVSKPFDVKELVSRVRAVLRRYSAEPHHSLVKLGELRVDLEKRQVKRGDLEIQLTALEFDLFKVMAENPGRVYSRMQLLDKLQGEAYEGYERTIDSHIKNLRKKIEPDPEHPKFILTVHGVGYKATGGMDA
jgi:DNA-binding response OmpR family regulator